LAFLSTPEQGGRSSTRVAMAQTNLHQPRAMAYDAKLDTLYVAGFGSDDVMALANVSQQTAHARWTSSVSSTTGQCGPTGLAVVAATGDVAVWCSLTQQVAWLDGGNDGRSAAPAVRRRTEQLAKSHLSAPARRGRDLFRSGNNLQISTGGAMACSSCHAEVRADGLSWRLQGNNLQTPFLAGRVEGAHPFKWDGKDPTLKDSLTNTVMRLGGNGITAGQAGDLAAFLKTVEAPRKPTVEDPAAVSRGKALFASSETGCATCHSGPLMTDQQSYDLSTDLGKVDTPSLVGLANSAPYYHDGSAATLDALMRGNANVHGMGRISKLSDAQVSDLVQFLKTL
ncbi:MAG: c-type cytochrome, partial [Myxococcota bacterium]